MSCHQSKLCSVCWSLSPLLQGTQDLNVPNHPACSSWFEVWAGFLPVFLCPLAVTISFEGKTAEKIRILSVHLPSSSPVPAKFPPPPGYSSLLTLLLQVTHSPAMSWSPLVRFPHCPATTLACHGVFAAPHRCILTEMPITSPHPQSWGLQADFSLPGSPKRWQ